MFKIGIIYCKRDCHYWFTKDIEYTILDIKIQDDRRLAILIEEYGVWFSFLKEDFKLSFESKKELLNKKLKKLKHTST